LISSIYLICLFRTIQEYEKANQQDLYYTNVKRCKIL